MCEYLMRSKLFTCLSNMSGSSVAPVDTLAVENQAELDKRKPIDINKYATKKTVAQGMLDIALLTANASQLKYILQSGDKLQFYTLLLWLISASILLQVFMGLLFLSLNMLRDLHLHLIEYKKSANLLNHIELACAFAVTTLNILIGAFDPGLGSLSYQQGIGVGALFLIIGGLNINEKPDHRSALVLNDIILLMIFLISTINVIISGFGLSSNIAGIPPTRAPS